MDINVLHRYSHLEENLLRLTYDNLGFKLAGTLQVCDGCAESTSKARDARKKTYTRSSNTGERMFLDTTGPFLESLIGNWHWIWHSRRLQPFFMKFLYKDISCNC